MMVKIIKQINVLSFLLVCLVFLTGFHVQASSPWTIDSSIKVGSTFKYSVYDESGCPTQYDSCAGYVLHYFNGVLTPIGLEKGTTTTATIKSISDSGIAFNWQVNLDHELGYRNSNGTLVKFTNHTTDDITMNRTNIAFFDKQDMYYPFVSNDLSMIKNTLASNSEINVTSDSTSFTVVGNHTVHSADSGKTYIEFTNIYTLSGILISSSYTLHYTAGTSAPYDPYAFVFKLQLVDTSIGLSQNYLCTQQPCVENTSNSSQSTSNNSNSPVNVLWMIPGFALFVILKKRIPKLSK